MRKPERRCPPYEGGDPYLYLCFAEKDREAVFPLLEHLYRRGVRIWYSTETTSNIGKLNRQQERMNGASLVVLYLTENVRRTGSEKNTLLYYQRQGKPVISIDTDGGDNELSVGLTPAAKHIDGQTLRSAEELEAALIRTDGFSQELIGDPPVVKNTAGRAAAVILAAALLVAGISYYGYKRFGWFVTWIMPQPAQAITRELAEELAGSLKVYETEARPNETEEKLKALPDGDPAGKLTGEMKTIREAEEKRELEEQKDRMASALAAVPEGSRTPPVKNAVAFAGKTLTEALGDPVVFADAELEKSLKAATGSGIITTKLLDKVTELKLEKLPSDFSELKRLPNLSVLILPQDVAGKALKLADGQYTIVLAPEKEAAQ